MVKRFVLGDDCGLGKCQVPETKIITKRGVINLLNKTLWYKKNQATHKEDTFYDIPNEIALASDGCKKATQVYYGGKKPTIYFKTKLGTWGQSTHNHRWKVMCEDGFIRWKKTSELKINDFIAVGREQNVWGYKKLEKDLAWFLGMIVGDGHYNDYLSKNSQVTYSQVNVVNTHDDTNKKIWSCAEKYFKIPKIKEDEGRKEGYLPLTIIRESKSKDAKYFMLKYGLDPSIASTKKIPESIMGSNKETVCSFLQGLFDSDGCVNTDGIIEITLASKDLIEDVQLLLLNMGITNTQNIHHNKKYKKDYYRLTITDFLSRKKFYNWICFSVDYKKERLRSYVYKEREVNVTYDVIPYQQDRIRKIGDIIPKGLRWAFKDPLKSRSNNAGNLTYDCARKILSFGHEEFFKNSKEFKELEEIVKLGYFFTPITELIEGGDRDVYDLSVPDGNTYLANGMVSHNTLQTIATYVNIFNRNQDFKLMIICPSSAMYQWQNEVKKFCTDDITCQIVKSGDIKHLDGQKLKSKDSLKSFDAREHLFKEYEKNNNNVLIFNYNTLVTDSHIILELMNKYKFLVVFDEATAFKNTKSNTFTYATEVSKKGDRIVGLSATIIKNNLLEAFSIYKVIVPGLFISLDHFKKNYCIMEKVQLWKGKGQRGKVVNKITGYKNLTYFKDAIDPYFLGRKKTDVAKELPGIISKEIIVDMFPKQRDIYDDALLGFLDYDKYNFNKVRTLFDDEEVINDSEIESKETKQIDKLTALIYCQQICNAPELLGFKNTPSAKEEELLRILETELQGEKVVIYTRFKTVVNRLDDLITSKLKVKVTKITGSIKPEQREDNKFAFNNSTDTNVMIINSAAKEAVNLQSSGYLFFYDLPFSYGDFLQIIGRIHRIGSPHEKIFLMYMICRDSVDEKTHGILSSKKELFDAILGDSAVGAIKIDKSVVNTLFDEMVSEAQKRKENKI
jgi:intein/homing endonuclease/superfamily II DNA or RNA helicase